MSGKSKDIWFPKPKTYPGILFVFSVGDVFLFIQAFFDDLYVL